MSGPGEQLLEHAGGVLGNRQERYGEANGMFTQIAGRWSMTLGVEISPAQVALCMIDLKMARLSRNPQDFDSAVDIAGYAACLREVL